jgi:hypothetical protein
MKTCTRYAALATSLLLVAGDGCKREAGVADTQVRLSSSKPSSAGSLEVISVGGAHDRYFVYAASGNSLTNADTNTAVELPPGDYRVSLNGSSQPLTVHAGEKATVTAGSAMVAGTGKDRYFVYAGSGSSLTNADTNTAVELFPGDYRVSLNGSSQPLTVHAGKTATVTAGSAMVAGTGKDRYFVSAASGNSLTNADTNTAVELFPGDYRVGLNGSSQPLTVHAGEKATVTAGSVMVAGTGKNRYFVEAAAGNSLTNADTNTAVELFPGTYLVEIDGVKQQVTVREGKQAMFPKSP